MSGKGDISSALDDDYVWAAEEYVAQVGTSGDPLFLSKMAC